MLIRRARSLVIGLRKGGVGGGGRGAVAGGGEGGAGCVDFKKYLKTART